MSDLHHLGRRLCEIALAGGGSAAALGSGEFLVAEDLALHGRSTIGDITRRTGMAQSAVSTRVRGLVLGGLAVTTEDPADRRRTLVDLVPEARGAVCRRSQGGEALLVDALGRAGAAPGEISGLLESLERLCRLLVGPNAPAPTRPDGTAACHRTEGAAPAPGIRAPARSSPRDA